MARKSRKQTVEQAAPVIVQATWNAGGYVRLSAEDKHDGNGCSLDNQIVMVEKYIEDTADINLGGLFTDNGLTGTNFDRPGFESLMDTVRSGQINCIVVKDLSRFGRDYVEAGNLLEVVFPRLGVRFISIGDNYDSFDPRCQGEGMTVALKNMINSFYAKDISVKTRSAYEEKHRRGEFTGTQPPYGYRKDPANKNHLIVDEEAAAVVRDIFRWKLEGLRMSDIRKRLDDMGVPTPGHYRYIRGIHKDSRFAGPRPWDGVTVRLILENVAYLGHMATGKVRVDPNQTYSMHDVPKDQWTVVENTHEPIVSQEDFDAAAVMLEETMTRYYSKVGKRPRPEARENLFAGLAYCADCGRVFQRIQHMTEDGKEWRFTYICPTCKRSATDRASRRYFKERDFVETVYSAVRQQVDVCTDTRRLIERLNSSRPVQEKRQSADEEISRLRQRAGRLPSMRMKLYDDFCDGLLSESDYHQMKVQYDREIEQTDARLTELSAQQEKHRPEFADGNEWVKMIDAFRLEKKLTREMLTALVERIEVGGDLSVSITFKYHDEYMALRKYIEESEAAKDERE